MKLTPEKLNQFSMIKLPSAWLCGVRVSAIDDSRCVTSVRHRWINQNPFNSMFWAVQGMAAELSTGAMLIGKIRECGKPVSMLVANNKANFSKKAKGRITFECLDGAVIDQALTATLATGEGQTFWMESIGKDEKGDVVSTFQFEWTIKLRS
ncbi:DUF4442 domain-containing protein [Robertkochia solimangrovi]|uniref:DUF4442 domain-containing protein n=1 Tax=Robertkochia solimangrovi TaxID=2213046 RepID=UPI00117CDB32|nr:DUF4442 domain-containing protein [Robertkochia solimangrovi]TRZ41089.1 thioesterase [Robertkochia solimangrovi]